MHPDTVRRKLKAAGYHRTAMAIVAKRRELRIMRDAEAGGYTQAAVAEIFGVSTVTVRAWRDRGLLRVRRAQSHDAPENRRPVDGARWVVSARELRRFIVENVSMLDFTRLDKFVVVDLLAGHSL